MVAHPALRSPAGGHINTWRNYFRPLALVVGTGWLVASTGCYSWAAHPGRTSVAPMDVRLTMRDGATLQLFHAQVVGDSIMGSAYDQRGNRTDSSVAVAHVRTTEYHEIHAGKTIALVLGCAAGFGLIVAVGMGLQDLQSGTYY